MQLLFLVLGALAVGGFFWLLFYAIEHFTKEKAPSSSCPDGKHVIDPSGTVCLRCHHDIGGVL